MKATLSVVLFFFVSISGFSQNYYAECISIPGYSLDDIQINTSGEICLSGYKWDPYSPSILKRDKYGNQLWGKDFEGGSVLFDDIGNAYVLSYDYVTQENKFYKYLANGTSAWVPKTFSLPQSVASYAVDQSGNSYLLTGLQNSSNWRINDIYVQKYNATGTLVWETKVTDKSSVFSLPALTVNNAGEVFVVARIEYDSENLLVGSEFFKLDAGGVVSWVSSFAPQPIEQASLYQSIYLDNTGNLLGTISKDPFDSDFALNSDFYRINSSSGNIEAQENVLLGELTVNITGNNIFVLGRQEPQNSWHVLKLAEDLTSLMTIDISPSFQGKYYMPTSILVDPSASIYVSGKFNSDKDLFVNKYVGGEHVNQFRYPHSSYDVQMAIDFEGNFLIPGDACLLKIVPCSNVQFLLNNQPQNTEVCPGDDALFQVNVTGKELSYYWYKGTDQLSNSTKFEGVNSALLKIKQAGIADAGSYYCEVRDACGRNIKTQTATLSVISPPGITAHPQNVSQCAGTDTFFQITSAGGKNVKYQWKKGPTLLQESGLLIGTKTSKLTLKTISASDAGEYFCEVTADCSTSPLSSQKATLGVLSPTAISKNPESLVSCTGNTVNFSVNASGTGLTYQWRKGGTDIAETSRITGAKTSTLTLSVLQVSDAGDYTCVVSGTCGGSLTSSKGTLSVTAHQQITSHPVNKALCSGTSASFSVAASGSGATYQWMKGNTILTNNTKFSGATTATLTVATASIADEGAYSCVVTTLCGDKLTSNVAQLTTATPATIVAKSADLSLCTGDLAKFSITTTGSGLTYQWKKDGVPVNDETSVAGSKTNELFIQDVTYGKAGNYTCEVISSCGPPQVSGSIKLEIEEQAIITEQPVSRHLCDNEELVLKVKTQGGTPLYQWKRNGVDLENDEDISGAQTETLAIKNVAVSVQGHYTCEVKGCGGIVSSEAVWVSVNPTPDLVLNFNCNNFLTDWSSLVTDTQNTHGEYFLFEEGSSEPLQGLNFITKTGNYVIVKQTQFCSDTLRWDNQCESIVTGIEEDPFINFSISPNPTNRWIWLRYDPKQVKDFEVYDSRGIKVISGESRGEGEMSLDGSSWVSGMYLVMLRDDKGHFTFKRFILQR